MSNVAVDYAKVQESAAHLKQNPPTKEEISADPKAFLAKHGVTISDDMNSQIKERLGASAANSEQALLIHIDIPV